MEKDKKITELAGTLELWVKMDEFEDNKKITIENVEYTELDTFEGKYSNVSTRLCRFDYKHDFKARVIGYICDSLTEMTVEYIPLLPTKDYKKAEIWFSWVENTIDWRN